MRTTLARAVHCSPRLLLLACCLLTGAISAQAEDRATFGSVAIGNGITLHYTQKGAGDPVIFVHGSLSDYTYWSAQVDAFSLHYTAIAYSRRYNYPNQNPARSGYSAITDADDLAEFIHARHLKKVFLVGHSYGALTALFLAQRHPELVRAMVLAEPPAVSLLNDLPQGHAAEGKAIFQDIQTHLVEPMKASFLKGDTSGGVAIFINYVFNDPHRWQNFTPEQLVDTLRDAHEWDVMMTSGTLFPVITSQQVRNIKTPALILSGGQSYPFLSLIDQELGHLLPHSQSITYPDAGHQMWLQHPQQCREDVENFFRTVTSNESERTPSIKVP